MTKLYDAKQHILIHTGYADPLLHRHMAAHIILGINGAISVSTPSQQHSCWGVMIPSDVPHKIDTHGGPVLVFLYDSTSSAARQITNVQSISSADCMQIVGWYEELVHNKDKGGYHCFEKRFLQQLGISQSAYPELDERISEAMHYVQTRVSEPISCHDVAHSVCLSAGRFSHLFKQQVGVTFASYLINQRLIAGYSSLIHGKPITAAAMDAGFSSASHFADTSRRIFGLSASKLTKDLIFFKIK